jgi:hypothetical protein
MKFLKKSTLAFVALCALAVSATAVEPQKDQKPPPPREKQNVPKPDKPPPPPRNNDNKGDKKGNH